MNSPSSEISDADLGERLRLARETAKFTQAAAATAVGVARTTLLAIEQGQRPIKLQELQHLAKLYGTSVNTLLRQEAVHVDLVPRFRKLTGDDDPSVEAAARTLNDFVRAEVELENVLGLKRLPNYPPEKQILPGNVRAQAEQDAQELRHWLGLGLSPIQDVLSLIELQLGIRTYLHPLGGKISGLFAFDDTVGACMLINACHRRDRRAQSIAHELGHFTATRRRPEVLHDSPLPNSRDERYADSFGRSFMAPARAVMQKFQEVTAGAPNVSRRHVIILAHYFGISREALVRRLEELELAKQGTWDWFLDNDGISDEQARQVLGDRVAALDQEELGTGPVSLRLGSLAVEALDRGLMSEGQIARLLQLDRIAVRQLQEQAAGDDASYGPPL